MRRYSTFSLSVLLVSMIAISGCGTLLDFIRPRITTARFVNNGDFPVDVTVYYSDIQELPALLLTQIGEKVEFTVPAGATHVLRRDCDDLQAIIVADADLRVIGGIGPSTNSSVQRDGSDFSCGSTITFTFDHSALILDFGVSVSVSQPSS